MRHRAPAPKGVRIGRSSPPGVGRANSPSPTRACAAGDLAVEVNGCFVGSALRTVSCGRLISDEVITIRSMHLMLVVLRSARCVVTLCGVDFVVDGARMRRLFCFMFSGLTLLSFLLCVALLIQRLTGMKWEYTWMVTRVPYTYRGLTTYSPCRLGPWR